MKLDIYNYHTNPTQLIGFDFHVNKLDFLKQAQYLTTGLYISHHEKFTSFTNQMSKAFDQADDGDYSRLTQLTDYVHHIPGLADKFKDRIKKLHLTSIDRGLDMECVFKLCGVSAEHYADTRYIYEYLNANNRFDACISKQYFEDIQLAVSYVWNKRRFSIYGVVPYLQQSPEIKQYITKEMLDDITDEYDKQVLRNNGFDI